MPPFRERFDLFVFGRVLSAIREQGQETLNLLLAVRRELGMLSAEVKAFALRMDAATNNIAADIRRLKDKSPTMSEEDKAELDRIAGNSEAIAADPENPDPEPTPPTEPASDNG